MKYLVLAAALFSFNAFAVNGYTISDCDSESGNKINWSAEGFTYEVNLVVAAQAYKYESSLDEDAPVTYEYTTNTKKQDVTLTVKSRATEGADMLAIDFKAQSKGFKKLKTKEETKYTKYYSHKAELTAKSAQFNIENEVYSCTTQVFLEE